MVAQDVDVLGDESGDIRLVSSTGQARKQSIKNATKPAVGLSFADEEEIEAAAQKKVFPSV